MYPMSLSCNNISCSKVLSKVVVITPCSHVFCTSCCRDHKKYKICIACGTDLTGMNSLLQNISHVPSFVGINPMEILEELQKAVSFWMHQKSHKQILLEAKLENLQNCLDKTDILQHKINTQLEAECEMLRKKIEKMEIQIKNERENAYELSSLLNEKNQKFQSLYREIEALKNGKNNNILANKLNNGYNKMNKKENTESDYSEW